MHPIWELPLGRAGILVELDNGSVVRIRPVRSSDREGLLAAFEHLSAESRYMRFFSPRPRLSEAMVTQFTDVDDVHQLAWAVFDPDVPSEVGDPSGLPIASARLFVDEPAEPDAKPTSAEATLVVVDEYQRRGLGRFLIELLVCTAATYGFDVIRFEVLHENHSMRALLGKVGASAHAIPGDRTVIGYTIDVPDVDEIDSSVGALYALLRKAEQSEPGVVEP